jgi:hypothetical protein
VSAAEQAVGKRAGGSVAQEGAAARRSGAGVQVAPWLWLGSLTAAAISAAAAEHSMLPALSRRWR